MSENKRFRVNDLVKYNYSEIGEYIDENHTDRPLRNDELCKLLNELNDENNELKKENEKLKKRLLLYEINEDEVDNYLRTHPMPTTTTITNKRKVIPLNMRHRWY